MAWRQTRAICARQLAWDASPLPRSHRNVNTISGAKPRHLELDVNDREATLTGETFDGRLIQGPDRVTIKE
jgi:hypothetical protein